MNYQIITTKNFEKEVKRLAKKFPSLKTDLENLQEKLYENPFIGDPIGNKSFKIRFAVKSKGKGKRGGMRIITHIELDFVMDDLSNVYLLTIYDKSETENITNIELRRLLNSKDL